MTNEPEWKDVNPSTADLPGKGKAVILCIAGGIALGAVGFIGMKIRPVGLAVGVFAFFTGIGMLLRTRKQKADFRPSLILTVAGFLILLANPRFGYVASFAGYFLITGAIGLVVLGLGKAVKLAWDLGKSS